LLLMMLMDGLDQKLIDMTGDAHGCRRQIGHD
jgi:hypothetical protein